MRNPVQLTKSGSGFVAGTVPLSKTASIAQIMGVADTTVALDVDVYVVVTQTNSAPSSLPASGFTYLGKLRAVIGSSFVLPLVGGSGGYQVTSQFAWVCCVFNDTGVAHQAWFYQDQE